MLFVGSCSGNLYALNRNTGTVRWSYNIKQDGSQTSFHGDSLVIGNLILIGTDGGKQGHIYAFERATGKVRWKRQAPAGAGGDIGVASDIVQNEKYIYAVAQGDELMCLNLNDGSIHWSFSSTFDRTKFGWSNSPVVNGNLVFFGGLDGRLYALTAESGRIVWSRDLHSSINTTPVISKGSIYVGTKDDYLYQLQCDDGRIVNSIALPALPWRHVSTASASLFTFVFHEKTGGAFMLNDLVSIDLSLGSLRWLHHPPELSAAWTSARPYLWHGDVLAGDEEGKLFAFHQHDGSVAWMYQFPVQAIRGIGVTKTLLYVGTIRGMVYAFDPEQVEKTDT